MKAVHVPGLAALLACACSLLAPDDDYFSGGSGGAANAGGTNAGGTSAGGTSAGGAGGVGGSDAHAGTGATSSAGAGDGGAGASSGGRANGGDGGADAGGGGTDAGSGGVACTLAPTTVESEPCGACNTGKHTRTLTLKADCTYAAGAWGECSGVTAACTPGATSACLNGDSCGQRRCSDSCSWSACAPKTSGGCLRIREGHTDEGSNYQCCGAGHWQFCLPSCQWSASCVACSQGAPNYCTEC